MCPRCGRVQPPDQPSTGACFYCGQFLPTVDWVATPPAGLPAAAPKRHRPYTGPPSYPVPPRWGFPMVTWRQPTSFEPPPASHRRRAAMLAGNAQWLLWLASVTCVLAAVAEAWRYLLLLDSRTDALPAGPLRMSDTLVVTGGLVSVTACVLAGLVTLAWLRRAYLAAAELAGVAPSRSTRELLLGWLAPGLNLFVPGSSLAEIEHAALGRPASQRPDPSLLLRVWWAVWALGLLLAGWTLLWSLRDGTQALADGVVLHALVDLSAAVTAGLTAVVVRRLTVLLQPVPPGRRRRMAVVRVGGSASDGQRGQAADDELGAADRLASQPQPR
jgi:Domain of unknown function (DUF4328)